MQNIAYSGGPIRSATPGAIVGPVGGSIGQVRVYDELLDETIIYLHMKNIPNWVVQKTYDVDVGDIIGYEGQVGAESVHLHIQAEDFLQDGTYINSGSDMVLESRIPYWYVNFWI